MKRAIRFAAVIAVATVAGGGQAASPQRGCDTGTAIADEADLRRLLRCAAPGSTILLARDAQFGVVGVNRVTSQPLTIRSLDPLRPARFQGLVVRNSTGITLRDLAFESTGPGNGNGGGKGGTGKGGTGKGGTGKGQRSQLTVTGSSFIRLERLSMAGNPVTFRPDLDAAVLVRNSRNVTISGLRIEGYRNGIALRDSSQLEVSGNSIRRMQTDGVRASGVQDLRIVRNVIASFSPAPPDHPDGIQLWARNPAQASQRILIEQNLILRGTGTPIQGIFLRAAANAPFRNVTIRDNLIVGQRWNGIGVMGADGVEVTGNTVSGLDRQQSWVRMVDCVNAVATGNRAARYVLSAGVRDGGNVIAGPSAAGPTGLVTQWRERLGLGRERFPE